MPASTPASAAPAVSVSERASLLVDKRVADAAALRCVVSSGEAGERRVDCGAETAGGLEAGRRLGEICMGGLGNIAPAQVQVGSPHARCRGARSSMKNSATPTATPAPRWSSRATRRRRP